MSTFPTFSQKLPFVTFDSQVPIKAMCRVSYSILFGLGKVNYLWPGGILRGPLIFGNLPRGGTYFWHEKLIKSLFWGKIRLNCFLQKYFEGSYFLAGSQKKSPLPAHKKLMVPKDVVCHYKPLNNGF